MTLYFPRVEAEAPAKVAEQLTVPTPTGAGETVLVVEDEEAVRRLVVEVLQDSGYRVIPAANGEEATATLRSSRTIDFLVTDVGLPGLNGRQLAEIARQLRPDLPVLFLTGYAADATSRAAFLEPGMEMLTKPVEMTALVAKIAAMLSRPAA